MSSFHSKSKTPEASTSTSTEIEKLFMSFSPAGQAEALKKLLESMKHNPQDFTSPDSSPQQPKRVLNTPETPFKGHSRTKVYLFLTY
jgi:hypothetical protein